MDMRWASPLDRTWRDEIITIVMSVPLVGCFIPGLREYIFAAFEDLKRIDPSAPSLFIWGWGIILATTFGLRGIRSMFMPSKVASLVKAMGENSLVSEADMATAQEAVANETPIGAGESAPLNSQ